MDVQFASSSRLSVEDIMPHPTTVSRAVATAAKTERLMLATEMRKVLSLGHCISFTADMWTDQYKQVSYLTITGHWISEDWQLVSRVLCTEDFDSTQKKTGDNIHRAIVTTLRDLDIDIGTDMVTFTTDRGANMIAALRSDERLDCIAHVLNTVLRNAFDPKKGCPVQVCTLLTAVKNIVRYFKKSGYQTLLPKALQQSCDSRWNSVYFMLQSLHVQYDEVGPTFIHLVQEIVFFIGK